MAHTSWQTARYQTAECFEHWEKESELTEFTILVRHTKAILNV